jgi:hypothetical protein
MFLIYLTLITALSVSAIAIYYSVVGLTTIFAASVIPVAIMGTALEVAKLVTAVWLHKHWRTAVWWLKGYLSIAVIVLMFITSMGIFGFLSKSHIEQTAASDEQTAKIQTINGVISRGEAKIARLQTDINRLSSGTADTRVDSLIEREQKELERLTSVANTEKDTLRSAAQRNIDSINDKIEAARATMETELANTLFGKTAVREKFETTRTEYNQEIQSIQQRLAQELDAVDNKYADNFADVNARLAKLKTQSEEKTGTIETRISDIESQLTAVQKEVDASREERAVLESAFRQLEAEVGPVKYIAEFIYSKEADRNLLEEAVRWVIVTIIFVFDPLAVLLLIASQYSFEQAREKREPEKQEPAYEADDGPLTDAQVKQIEESVDDTDDIWNTVPVLQEPRPAAPKKKKTVTKKKKKTVKEDKNEQVDANKEPAQETQQTTEESNGRISTDEEVKVRLTRVGDEYISYDGKMYRDHALIKSHPELHLDLQHEVPFGPRFPVKSNEGRLFLRSDLEPTKLYRSNGVTWDPQDKNILSATAYSADYIEMLVDKIASGDYDPELLNIIEKQKIQEKIANDL